MKKMQDMIWAALGAVVRSVLRFDRRVIKAYTGIETPLYKLWWRQRAAETRRLLNEERINREMSTLIF